MDVSLYVYLDEGEKNAIDLMIENNPDLVDVEDRYLVDMLIMFSIGHKFHVEDTVKYFRAHCVWCELFGVDTINIASVYELINDGMIVPPVSKDNLGRPVVVFRAGLYNVGKFTLLEVYKIFVYMCKIAIEMMEGDVSSIVFVNDLKNFSREQSDPRMIKFMFDMINFHYPNRVGGLYCINAPWYYSVLYAVVKPFINDDIKSTIKISSGLGDFRKNVEDADRLEMHEGNLKFDLDEWIAKRFEIEGIPMDLDNLDQLDTHVIDHDFKMCHSDPACDLVLQDCAMSGWLEKKGGYTPMSADRFCVLNHTAIFVYVKPNDDTPSGVVPLSRGSITIKSKKKFCITSEFGKESHFTAKSEQTAMSWIDAIDSFLN